MASAKRQQRNKREEVEVIQQQQEQTIDINDVKEVNILLDTNPANEYYVVSQEGKVPYVVSRTELAKEIENQFNLLKQEDEDISFEVTKEKITFKFGQMSEVSCGLINFVASGLEDGVKFREATMNEIPENGGGLKQNSPYENKKTEDKEEKGWLKRIFGL